MASPKLRSYDWIVRNRNVSIAFVLSLSLGYLTFFSGFYAKVFIVGLTPHYQITEERINLKCKDRICEETRSYQLQKDSAGNVDATFALGRLWNSATIKCGERNIAQFGEPGSVTLSSENFNVFHLIPESQFSTCGSDRVDVSVYYKEGQAKAGFLDGTVRLVSSREAKILKDFSTFVQQDLKTYNLGLSLLVLIFSIFIRIVATDESSPARIRMSLVSVALALLQSGLFELWLPFPFVSDATRVLSTVVACGWFVYAISYVSGLLKYQKVIVISSAVFALTVFGITQSRVNTLLIFSVVAAIFCTFVALRTKRISTFYLAILLGLTSSELFGLGLIRSGYTATTFVALIVLIENSKAFLSFLKINRLLQLSKGDRTVRRKHHNSGHGLVKLFQKQFGIKKVTILNITDTEVIHLYQYSKDKSGPRTISLPELTPIFAHVVSTGNALLNVHAQSAFVSSLRRGDGKYKIDSDYFTVVPLFSGNITIGAIALTDYDHEQFQSSLNYSTFLFCLQILKGFLVEQLLMTPKTNALEKISKLTTRISSMDIEDGVSEAQIIDRFGAALNEVFGWRIMSATLGSDNLLSVGTMLSFDPQVEEQVSKGKIYAHKDNRQGPIALAVHERKPVIIPNIKWLEGVVHPNTMKFFGIHATKTAAFVPVMGLDEKTVVGVYWIEGVRGNELSYSERDLFIGFMKSVNEKIKLISSRSKLRASNSTLGQFIPENLVERYLAGDSVVDKDHGFLMMFDLKGSTRLAHAIGNSEFRSEIARFGDSLKSALTAIGWKLKHHNWDSFEFTLSATPESGVRIDVENISTTVKKCFSAWTDELKRHYDGEDTVTSLSFRICFTFGDVTMGVVGDGLTRKWAFIGNAMAFVSKVEQASKALPGIVFCDESILSRSNAAWILLQTTNQGLKIYSLDEVVSLSRVA